MCLLECVLITSLAAVEVDESAVNCIVPKCTYRNIRCVAPIHVPVEWVNPRGDLINATDNRINSKKLVMYFNNPLTSMYIMYAAIPILGMLQLNNPQVSDSGMYTCRAKANHSDKDVVILTFTKCKKS